MSDAVIRLVVPTAEAMHTLGRDVARLVRAGDLVILTGELGAGKTQLTQGIGEGLRVHGAVISPTFVLSRIHRSDAGVNLIHVDAYRLTSPDELDDLDVEAYLPDSVIVVEWGGGLADHLSESRLDVEILRSADPASDLRTVTVTGSGGRWADLVAQWEQVVNEQEVGQA